MKRFFVSALIALIALLCFSAGSSAAHHYDKSYDFDLIISDLFVRYGIDEGECSPVQFVPYEQLGYNGLSALGYSGYISESGENVLTGWNFTVSVRSDIEGWKQVAILHHEFAHMARYKYGVYSDDIPLENHTDLVAASMMIKYGYIDEADYFFSGRSKKYAQMIEVKETCTTKYIDELLVRIGNKDDRFCCRDIIK